MIMIMTVFILLGDSEVTSDAFVYSSRFFWTCEPFNTRVPGLDSQSGSSRTSGLKNKLLLPQGKGLTVVHDMNDTLSPGVYR